MTTTSNHWLMESLTPWLIYKLCKFGFSFVFLSKFVCFFNLIFVVRHLGRNPFICDCNLRWLAVYLHERPSLETSDVRCEEPKRNNRKRISQISPDKFRCKGTEELRTKYTSQCLVDSKCPTNCVCDGTIVDCSRQNLHQLPDDVPTFATEL